MFPGRNAEGEIAQDRLIRAVTEADVFENHFTQSGGTEGSGIGILHDLQGLLHQFTDPLHRRQATLNLGEALRQLAQRIEQTLGIENERGEDSQAHGAGRHHPSAQGQHQGHRSQRHPFEERGDAAIEENRSIHRTAIGEPVRESARH